MRDIIHSKYKQYLRRKNLRKELYNEILEFLDSKMTYQITLKECFSDNLLYTKGWNDGYIKCLESSMMWIKAFMKDEGMEED